METLSEVLSGYKPGDTVTITLAREKESTARSFNPSGQGSVEAPKAYEKMQVTLTFQSNLVQTGAEIQ